MSKKIVCGIGINDADYVVMPSVNGQQVKCSFYRAWKSMLERCYSESCQKKHPTYYGCVVCKEWLTFSNFKSWMETQDWKEKELDKDILIPGNKIYSPEACVFVDSITNTFVTKCDASRGEWPIGVCFHKRVKKFASVCGNPFLKKQEYLGYFGRPELAHLAWKSRKHELSCQLADLQTDERVASALRERYAQ